MGSNPCLCIQSLDYMEKASSYEVNYYFLSALSNSLTIFIFKHCIITENYQFPTLYSTYSKSAKKVLIIFLYRTSFELVTFLCRNTDSLQLRTVERRRSAEERLGDS